MYILPYRYTFFTYKLCDEILECVKSYTYLDVELKNIGIFNRAKITYIKRHPEQYYI